MADNPVIPPGSVVWLRSGGPLMTAAVPDEDGNVECLWFEEPNPGAPVTGYGKLRSGVFRPEMLKLANPE